MNAALKAFVDRVESLRSLNEDVAKEAAPVVLAEIQRTTNAKQTPYGEPWPASADGEPVLMGAVKAITSRAQGSAVIVSVGPPYAYHNYGAGGPRAKAERKARASKAAAAGTKSKFHAPRRQMLPDAGEPIPDGVKEVITEVARDVFTRKAGD